MVWQMLGRYVRSLRKETLISFKSNFIITIFIGAHTVWTFGHVPQILDVLARTNKHHIHNSLKSWCRKQNSHRQWYAVICVVMITIKLCCWHLLVVASYGRSTDLWMNEWINKTVVRMVSSSSQNLYHRCRCSAFYSGYRRRHNQYSRASCRHSISLNWWIFISIDASIAFTFMPAFSLTHSLRSLPNCMPFTFNLNARFGVCEYVYQFGSHKNEKCKEISVARVNSELFVRCCWLFGSWKCILVFFSWTKTTRLYTTILHSCSLELFSLLLLLVPLLLV